MKTRSTYTCGVACEHTYTHTHAYIEAKPIKNTKSKTIVYKQKSSKEEKVSKSVTVFILSCCMLLGTRLALKCGVCIHSEVWFLQPSLYIKL